jgi:hypothetical protein
MDKENSEKLWRAYRAMFGTISDFDDSTSKKEVFFHHCKSVDEQSLWKALEALDTGDRSQSPSIDKLFHHAKSQQLQSTMKVGQISID